MFVFASSACLSIPSLPFAPPSSLPSFPSFDLIPPSPPAPIHIMALSSTFTCFCPFRPLLARAAVISRRDNSGDFVNRSINGREVKALIPAVDVWDLPRGFRAGAPHLVGSDLFVVKSDDISSSIVSTAFSRNTFGWFAARALGRAPAPASSRTASSSLSRGRCGDEASH